MDPGAPFRLQSRPQGSPRSFQMLRAFLQGSMYPNPIYFLSIYLSIYLYMCVYIYIYRGERERERDGGERDGRTAKVYTVLVHRRLKLGGFGA